MATTKTIKPTNTTITIPAMSDAPNMSVVATDIDRITDAVNATNAAGAITISAAANVTIDSNKSYYWGKFGIIAVSGHATADLTNEKLFDFSVTGKTQRVVSAGVGIFTGTRWTITGYAYGYVGDGNFVSTLTNGQYFHIYIPVLYE